MKLSTSLLQAITLGVSVTAVAASTTSCEKQQIKKNKAQVEQERTEGSNPNSPENCIACGMG